MPDHVGGSGDSTDPIEAAAAIEVAMRNLGRKFDNVQTFAAETRAIARKTRMLSVGVAVGAVIALLAGGYAIDSRTRADDAKAETRLIQSYLTASCTSANETRAAQRGLWDYIVKLSEKNRDPKRSPAEQQRLADFRAYVQETFADRDCAKVAQGRVR